MTGTALEIFPTKIGPCHVCCAMTVKDLLPWLKACGCEKVLSNDTADGEREIASTLSGAVIAVDAALLLTQATKAMGAHAGMSPEVAAVNVALSRTMKLLRAGAVVVGVTEDQPPKEKQACLEQRSSSVWCVRAVASYRLVASHRRLASSPRIVVHPASCTHLMCRLRGTSQRHTKTWALPEA